MIEEPLWLRGAAVVAALAGLDADVAVAGFDVDDARSIARTLEALHAAGTRDAVAHAIARERLAVVSRRGSGAAPTEPALASLGARVAASLLRSLPAAERASLARSMDPALVRAAAQLAASTPPCDAATLASVVAIAARALGRMPSAVELGTVVAAALGRGEARAPAFVHATLRTARARGLRVAVALSPLQE